MSDIISILSWFQYLCSRVEYVEESELDWHTLILSPDDGVYCTLDWFILNCADWALDWYTLLLGPGSNLRCDCIDWAFLAIMSTDHILVCVDLTRLT